jgi:hypothetical protein
MQKMGERSEVKTFSFDAKLPFALFASLRSPIFGKIQVDKKLVIFSRGLTLIFIVLTRIMKNNYNQKISTKIEKQNAR